jgi:uncharacterized membrane protein YhaH (DUF805 family)
LSLIERTKKIGVENKGENMLWKTIKWLAFSAKGRANIPQIWASMIISYGFAFLGIWATEGIDDESEAIKTVCMVIPFLIAAWIKVAVSIKRCHDLGHSGTLLLLGFVPLANLYLLTLYLQPSKNEANEYGEKPKWLSMPSVTAGFAPIQEVQPEIA